MQQLQFIKKGVLEWHDVPEPILEQPTDVLVRPLAVARCDLDTAILYGLTPFRGPFPFGHEFVAEILSVGEEVKLFKAGQRVIVPFQVSCGGCPRCRKGISSHCSTVEDSNLYGLGRQSRQWGGAFSDLVRVPFADHMLVALPDGIDPNAVASASDNLADAWRTVGPHLKINPDTNVLIVGGGAASIGVYTVAIARALGAAQMDYIDNDVDRLRLAESAGAKVIEGLPGEKIGSYGITVDASANAQGLAYALRSVEPGGFCTSVGIYWQDTPMPLFDMYTTGVTFNISVVNSREVIPEVLLLVSSGKLQPEKFTTRLASWSDAPDALMERTTKVIIARDL